jgi:hypothetical protein
MRRSVHIAAPLLAATAAITMSACNPPASTSQKPTTGTLTHGFGSSFSPDGVVFILGIGVMVFLARAGG